MKIKLQLLIFYWAGNDFLPTCDPLLKWRDHSLVESGKPIYIFVLFLIVVVCLFVLFGNIVLLKIKLLLLIFYCAYSSVWGTMGCLYLGFHWK